MSVRGVWRFSMCQSGVYGVSLCVSQGCLAFLYVSVRGVRCVSQGCLVFLYVSVRGVWCFPMCQSGCLMDHLSLPVLLASHSWCDFTTSEKDRWNVGWGPGGLEGRGGGDETLTLVRADWNVKLRQCVPQHLVGIIFLSTYAGS